MTNNTQETKYYNTSTSTACYINEIKRVKPNRGNAFLAVKASIVEGPMDNPVYQSVDLIVKGEQAKHVLALFEDQWPLYSHKNRPTIFANIRFGSLGVKPFLTGNGEPAAVLSGRLIKVNFVSLNKEVIFQESSDDAETDNTSQPAPAQQQAPVEVQQPQPAPVAQQAPVAHQAAPVAAAPVNAPAATAPVQQGNNVYPEMNGHAAVTA